MLQDQIYCINILVAQKLKYLRKKFSDFFHGILSSYAKSNTSVAMGITPNCSARYELTFRISFNLLNT